MSNNAQMTLTRRSNESEITLTRPSNDPQTTLKRPSNGPPTTSQRPSNDPQTAPKRPSNALKQSTKPTYTNNYLKRRSDIAQSALTRPLYTLRPSPCPAHPDSRSGYRSACLRPWALSAPNFSQGPPGFTGALLPLRSSPIRASGPFGVLKALGLKRSKPPRHFRPASTPPWDLLYFLLCPKDHLRWCLFFLLVHLSLSLSFTWSHSCKPFCLCPEQAFLRWMKQCGP